MASVSSQWFHTHHMAENTPVVLQGLSKSWSALSLWTSAPQDEKCAARAFGQSRKFAEELIKIVRRKGFSVGDDLCAELNAFVSPCEQSRSTNGCPCSVQTSHTYSGSYPTIDWDYLRRAYGDMEVCVAKCQTKEFTDQARTQMRFSEWINRVQTTEDTKNESDTGEKLYVKDWHLRLMHQGPPFYSVPPHFEEDWINECCEEWGKEHAQKATQSRAGMGKDDYRFVYMGPTGSWTPWHRDVFCSYSWSSNVVGHKLWILCPPKHAQELIDPATGECVYDMLNVDVTQFAHAAGAIEHCQVLLQHPGETIFVPSGWYHQVWNLEDTISINHNWSNGYNLGFIWTHLQQELFRVRRELSEWGLLQTPTVDLANASSERAAGECREDSDDAVAQCQTVLNANSGISFLEFCDFLLRCSAQQSIKLQECRPSAHRSQSHVDFMKDYHRMSLRRLSVCLSELLRHPHSRLLQKQLRCRSDDVTDSSNCPSRNSNNSNNSKCACLTQRRSDHPLLHALRRWHSAFGTFQRHKHERRSINGQTDEAKDKEVESPDTSTVSALDDLLVGCVSCGNCWITCALCRERQCGDDSEQRECAYVAALAGASTQLSLLLSAEQQDDGGVAE